MEFGNEKGEKCNRNGCDGVIEEHDTNMCCSCHISAPCSYCTDSRTFCPVCEWDGREEQIENDKKAQQSANQSVNKTYETFKPRTFGDLDRNKIDYLCLEHTHFSMIKKGVFPKGTTINEVVEVVRGTFGGRFQYFNENACEFSYVAYTD